MPMIALTPSRLADLLREAKEYHTIFERENGPDADWTKWYAEFLIRAMNAEGITHIALLQREAA